MKKNIILKRLVLTTITLLLLCNISGLAIGINKSTDTPALPFSMQNEVWVNDDFPLENSTYFRTIQAGVDHVNSNGIVNVCNGTYNENVIINKKITLVGVNEYHYGNTTGRPIITNPAVSIIVIGKNASGTDISNFSIINCNVAGILIMFSDSVNIHLNKITSNGKGIYNIKSPGCSIYRNVVSWNNNEAIFLERSNSCIIEYNFIQYNNMSGIEVYYSGGVVISRNNLSYNGNKTNQGGWNIFLQGNIDQGNTIEANNFYDNDKYGIIRFVQSRKNVWNDNYWNKHLGGNRQIIFGRNSFIFFSLLYPITFQIDWSPQEDPYTYICPVI